MRSVNLIRKRDDFQGRRSFMKISGMAALNLAASLSLPGAVKALDPGDKLQKVSKTRLAMGTFVTLTILCVTRQKAEEVVEHVFEEIHRLSALMNRFSDGSPIALLNREGCLKDAPTDIIEVVLTALKYYRLTKGAFDITIKPVLDLFDEKFSGKETAFPSEKDVKEALRLVGSDNIEVKGKNIRFKKAGMGISIDAIAKGYIIDKASQVLLGHGVHNHLVNAGGDIYAMGLRQDNRPWKVGVQDPAHRDEYLDIIDLSDLAVATSGNYENYYDKDKRYHHIVNPATGLSPSRYSSVSVIAPTAMDADTLSTSVFVMNPEEGIQLVESLPGCETLIICLDHHEIRSSGWKRSSR